jgi:hypothetical protein
MAKWVKKWNVRSSSNPNKDYTVSSGDDGSFGCSCIAWTRNRAQCKHIKFAQQTFIPDMLLLKLNADCSPIIKTAKNIFREWSDNLTNEISKNNPLANKNARYVFNVNIHCNITINGDRYAPWEYTGVSWASQDNSKLVQCEMSPTANHWWHVDSLGINFQSNYPHTKLSLPVVSKEWHHYFKMLERLQSLAYIKPVMDKIESKKITIPLLYHSETPNIYNLKFEAERDITPFLNKTHTDMIIDRLKDILIEDFGDVFVEKFIENHLDDSLATTM